MKKCWRWIRRWWWKGSLLLLAFAGGVWWGLPWCYELPEGLKQPVAESPVLRDRDGVPLRRLVLPDWTYCERVERERLPKRLVDATLAAEDARYYEHRGVDFLALARASRDRLKTGRVVSGASTITQQLAKLGSPAGPRTLGTKWREVMVARRLEMSWDKERILTEYFNRLPYGNRTLGPAAAVRFYFQKPLEDLSLGECALLAGLPQAPTALNPLKHPDRAIERRRVVLERMAKSMGYGRDSIARAAEEGLRLRRVKEERVAPWLAAVAKGRVQTTLDGTLQKRVEGLVKEELAKLKGAEVHHAAVVAVHVESGEIRALVSSGDWDDPRGGQINGALTPRSPGSALKPFLWLLAFERAGKHPGSVVADVPTRYRTREGMDAPQNFDRRHRGPVTVRSALACSLNVPAMRMLDELGGPRPMHELLRKMGMDTVGEDASVWGLGLTLGNAPVRLLDLTDGYAALARGGVWKRSRLFAEEEESGGVRLWGEAGSWWVSDILADDEARVPAFGRGGVLDAPYPLAVKTGTSSDFHDNWCVGYTPEWVVGVWAGNFDHRPMKGVSGVAGAGPILRRTMDTLQRSEAGKGFARPEGLRRVKLDGGTGKQALQGREEWLTEDRVPLAESADDRDEQGRIKLDPVYREWLAGEGKGQRERYTIREEVEAQMKFRVLAPVEGMTYVLDPELPNGGWLRVASTLPGGVEWSCETLTMEPGEPEPRFRLVEGEHRIVAVERVSGAKREVGIRVVRR